MTECMTERMTECMTGTLVNTRRVAVSRTLAPAPR
jgi:hypothetical protein